MKLYLFDTINRVKQYSEMLDVKTKVCNLSSAFYELSIA